MIDRIAVRAGIERKGMKVMNRSVEGGSVRVLGLNMEDCLGSIVVDRVPIVITAIKRAE